MIVAAIAAMDESRIIGKDNKLPWHLPEDMKHFSDLTRGHTVFMGRKTYESLPDRFRPLPGRKNVVASRNIEKFTGCKEVLITDSPANFIESARAGEIKLPSEKLWIIGGSQIYRDTMNLWEELYLTVVDGSHDGDAFFPEFESNFKLVAEEAGEHCRFLHFARK